MMIPKHYRRGSLLLGVGLLAMSWPGHAVSADEPAPPTCHGVPVTIFGTMGPDVIIGTDGPDSIVALAGADVVDGADGDDRICDSVEEGLGSTAWAFVDDAAADRFVGGAGNDDLNSSLGSNVLRGGTGDDYLFGCCEQRGGPGNDTLLGGSAGSELLIGGPGQDRVLGDGEEGLKEAPLGPGVDVIHGGEGNDYLSGQAGPDRIFGGAGHDFITGKSGRNRLSGGPGEDFIRSGRGHDDLLGGRGRDYLDAGAGDDRLSGGRAADVLSGGPGLDTANGGPGTDRCHSPFSGPRSTSCEARNRLGGAPSGLWENNVWLQ